MRRSMLAAALALAGCTASIPVRMSVASERDFGDEVIEPLLADVSEILGVPIVRQGEGYGAITVALVERGGMHGGEMLVADGCLRALWSEVDAVFLAHEITHALGVPSEDHLQCDRTDPPPHDLMCEKLDRHTDPSDVMFSHGEEIERELSNLNACTARGA